ncbi:hypothetical protein [Bartonella sp. LJL80]
MNKTPANLLGIYINELAELCAHESCTALGLVRIDKYKDIARLSREAMQLGSRPIELAFRKSGHPIPEVEKKSLKIRKKAFYTYEAYDLLTDKGKESPLDAILYTILRSTSAMSMVKSATEWIDRGYTRLFYWVPTNSCPQCYELDKQEVDLSSLFCFPPKGCECEVGQARIWCSQTP